MQKITEEREQHVMEEDHDIYEFEDEDQPIPPVCRVIFIRQNDNWHIFVNVSKSLRRHVT